MMPAAKHGDPQLGVDIHLCTVPPGVPAPLPTPHMSVVFDPFDYIPIIGATITVMGMKRATAGTAGTVVHIPPGFPFAPKLPDKDDELFMGSATVVADGDPMSHISHPVLSCQVAGMLSPFRLRKKGGPRIGVLPTVFNLAIPSTVFVGGPPTINLMGMAVKGAFSALGKIAKSGVFKRIRQKLFKNMKPGFLKCVILRAEPVNILSGAVSVEQEDFSLPGRLPVEWLRSYSSSSTHVGVCGIGWETLLDIRLQVMPGDGGVLLHGPGVGPQSFAQLPLSVGEAGAELELSDGARLVDDGDGWQVRTKDDRTYHFPRRLTPQAGPDGTRVHPIARITDRCGNALEIEHRAGLPVAITEAAGRRLALQHDNGRLVAVALVDATTQAEHVFVRYQYDAASDLVAVVDALGQPYRFAYEQHHMVRHTDRNGLSFHYAFDTTGPEGWRVVHAWGDGGLYDYHFEYLDALNERRITDSLGHVSLVRLDERGLPVSEIDPLGGMTVYEYDDAGRTTAVVDPGGKRTEYSYDDHGNLLQLTRPDGTAVATRFNADDRPVQVTDPNGSVWQQQWDARGLLVAQTSPLGHTSRYAYDGWGQLTDYTNPRGARTELRFDLVGNLVELRDALQHATRFAHDQLGNVIAKADPLERRTLYRYDAKGRLLGVKLPSGSTVACAYDAEDNLVRYTDENGAVTQLAYFGQGEIARRIQPDGHTVEYLYDTEERLTGVRNQRGELYELRRDPLGRVIDEVDYWGQSRRYAYDASGHLQASIDPLGRRIDYRCDPLGRIVQKLLPATPGQPQPETESFAYDANGNLVATANRHVTVTRTFDAEGQLVMELQQHAQGQSFQVSNAYDAAGNRIRRVTEHSAGAGHVVAFAFDLLDQPSGVRIDGGAPMRMHHDALGQLTEEELAPGLRRSARYDADGLLTEQTLSRSGGAGGEGGAAQTLFSTRYSYDRAGNLTSRDDSAFGRDSYLYDPMGRILQHTDPQGMLHQFFNDPAGDRLVTRVEGGGSVSTVLGRNDDWRREGTYQGTRYRFDRAGNLTQKHDAPQNLELAWDANQRLIASRRQRAGDAPPTVTTYAYDPLGRRLWKEMAGQRTWFGWDGHTIALDVIRESPREFVFHPEDFIPFAIINASHHPVQRFVNDANGAPIRLLGAAGQILWSASYSISAAIAQRPVRTIDNPIRLQGQYEDDETGLHYNFQRYYCPAIASFISLDPLGIEAGENVFAYGPNTYGWVDPLGLAKCKRTPKTSPFKQWMANKAKGGKDTHVYVLMKNKKVVYVGIAKNLNVRKAQHRKNKVFDKMVPLTTTPLHRGEARSIEQALIHNNPGFINEINSIAEKREIYGGAVNFGENWLAKNGHALTY